MKDWDDPDRFRFFHEMKRREAERMERWNDVEERKKFILRCASGGGMRHVKSRAKRANVSLVKMSWDK
jgi:hypothetical protein